MRHTHTTGRRAFRAERVARAGVAALVALTLVLAGQAPVGAQATRTWVAGEGDDANPCSRTAPCATFAGTISKTAAGGEINIIDAGAYGAVTITKALSIVAEGPTAGVLATGGTSGIIVNAGENDTVVLRGLDINGAGSGGNGIRYLAGRALSVEDTIINGFTGQGIDAQPTRGGELYVSDADIRNNGGAGIRLSSEFQRLVSVVERTRLSNNGLGLDARDNALMTVRDSVIAGNNGPGLRIEPEGQPAEVAVENTLLAFNGIGIEGGGGRPSQLRLSRVTIAGNGEAIDTGDLVQVTTARNNRYVDGTAIGAPEPSDCDPRPPVGIKTTQTGPGQITAVITATRDPHTPANELREIQFGPAQNGRYDSFPGLLNQTEGYVLGLDPGDTTVTVVLRRIAPGPFRLGFTVTDACGAWPTFIGGGADVS